MPDGMMSVAEPPVGSARRDLRDPVEQLRAVRRLNREWRPYLTAAERDLLFYLLDATVLWGRRTVRATMGQFVAGDGRLPALGQSLATLKRTLTSLQQKGLVNLKRIGAATEWAVNLEWEPKAVSRAHSLPASKCKRPEMEAHDEPGVAQNEVGERLNLSRTKAQSEPPFKKRDSGENGEQENNNSNCAGGRPAPPAAVGRSFSSALSRLSLRHDISTPTALAGATAHRSSTPPAPRLSSWTKPATPRPEPKVAREWQDTWETAWKNGWAEGLPGTMAPPVDTTNRMKLIGAAKRLKAFQPNLDFADFLEWSVSNWPQILRERFAWMRKPRPSEPELSFFAYHKFNDIFVTAYSDHLNGKHLDALPAGDEREIARLMASGKTREAALIEVTRRKLAVEQAEALTKQRAEIEQNARILAREEVLAAARRPVRPAQPQPTIVVPFTVRAELEGEFQPLTAPREADWS